MCYRLVSPVERKRTSDHGRSCRALALFGPIHEAYVGRQSFVERQSAVWVYRKLLIRTTSLVSLPLATNNCLPSRDQEKAKIRPEVKSVT